MAGKMSLNIFKNIFYKTKLCFTISIITKYKYIYKKCIYGNILESRKNYCKTFFKNLKMDKNKNVQNEKSQKSFQKGLNFFGLEHNAAKRVFFMKNVVSIKKSRKIWKLFFSGNFKENFRCQKFPNFTGVRLVM